jgi:hypothetical protein
MHKSATKCNETLSKWCKNKHGASKIMDTFETYQAAKSGCQMAAGEVGTPRRAPLARGGGRLSGSTGGERGWRVESEKLSGARRGGVEEWRSSTALQQRWACGGSSILSRRRRRSAPGAAAGCLRIDDARWRSRGTSGVGGVEAQGPIWVLLGPIWVTRAWSGADYQPGVA